MTHRKSLSRLGKWLPEDEDALKGWLKGFASKAAARPGKRHPVIDEFAELIADDPIVRMYLTRMIDEAPRTGGYRVHHLETVEQMLFLLNAVMTYAPEFDTTAFVGCPIDAILDWSMGTPAGFAAFRHPPINDMLRKVLTAWCEFLSSEASMQVINDPPSGWKCAAARGLTRIDDFEHDPDHPTWGFASWNAYFTREVRAERRPVAAPDDDSVIVSPCESTPYRIARNVRAEDRFWVKGQPYSIRDMLAGDPSADEFVGGTVHQAYLSAYNYHRWRSPVSGVVRRAFNVAGTYFSEADPEGEDPAGPNNSQAYIAHVAARAVILIEADDPTIGLVAVVPVGMGEISSCRIAPTIKPKARLRKGDELGFFQYGGSTCCLVFRPGAVAAFALGAVPEPETPEPPLVLVNSFLASSKPA